MLRPPTPTAEIRLADVHDPLNSRLQERGDAYDGLVSGAIEEIKFPFEQRGNEVRLKIQESSYAGVAKKDATFFSSPSVPEPIIGLPTSNGVGLLLLKASAVTGFNSDNVLERSQSILNGLTRDTAASMAFQGRVQFPKVEFRAASKPTWLIGAHPEGMNVFVDEAIFGIVVIAIQGYVSSWVSKEPGTSFRSTLEKALGSCPMRSGCRRLLESPAGSQANSFITREARFS